MTIGTYMWSPVTKKTGNDIRVTMENSLTLSNVNVIIRQELNYVS